MISRLSRLGLSATGLAGAAALCACFSGCVGYNVIAPSGTEPGFQDVNAPAVHSLMGESIRWTVVHYPPFERAEWDAGPTSLGDRVPVEGDGVFAINLPPGIRRPVYEMVVRKAGPGAVAMEPGRENMPTYHIGRVWVAGDEAKVDVLRPVPGMPPGPDGRPVTQGMTLRLRGGIQPWRVTSHNVWTINAMTVPDLYYIPEAPPPRAGEPGWKPAPKEEEAPPPEEPAAETFENFQPVTGPGSGAGE